MKSGCQWLFTIKLHGGHSDTLSCSHSQIFATAIKSISHLQAQEHNEGCSSKGRALYKYQGNSKILFFEYIIQSKQICIFTFPFLVYSDCSIWRFSKLGICFDDPDKNRGLSHILNAPTGCSMHCGQLQEIENIMLVGTHCFIQPVYTTGNSGFMVPK